MVSVNGKRKTSSGAKDFAVRRCPATSRNSVHKRDLLTELKKLAGPLDF